MQRQSTRVITGGASGARFFLESHLSSPPASECRTRRRRRPPPTVTSVYSSRVQLPLLWTHALLQCLNSDSQTRRLASQARHRMLRCRVASPNSPSSYWVLYYARSAAKSTRVESDRYVYVACSDRRGPRAPAECPDAHADPVYDVCLTNKPHLNSVRYCSARAVLACSLLMIGKALRRADILFIVKQFSSLFPRTERVESAILQVPISVIWSSSPLDLTTCLDRAAGARVLEMALEKQWVFERRVSSQALSLLFRTVVNDYFYQNVFQNVETCDDWLSEEGEWWHRGEVDVWAFSHSELMSTPKWAKKAILYDNLLRIIYSRTWRKCASK